ncbi:glycoside hydrolase [Candidatus Sumerlaeota bacterium]|nr:glycoside hydrolase [Candidatus Sumerlaeota bacterium]
MKTNRTAFAVFLLAAILPLSACDLGRVSNAPQMPVPTGRPDSGVPDRFQWSASRVSVGPKSDAAHDLVSIKDPTVVYFDGRWHVYATVADTAGRWSLVYLNFADWSEAASAPQHYLDTVPGLDGYKAAPQLFYFRPRKKWYLIYQTAPPQYSTADDPSEWQTWTRPRKFFDKEPAVVTENKGSGGWLDFFVICDAANAYLFFSDDNGHLYRSQTRIGDFPYGFGEPVIVLSDKRENLFEAGAHYKIQGMNKYLTLVEAAGPGWRRYYRSWVADRLDGEWRPLAATWENPFAGETNVVFPGGAAMRDIGHGELIRDGYDETMTIDLSRLRFLCQSMDPATPNELPYSQLPYRLILLTGR